MMTSRMVLWKVALLGEYKVYSQSIEGAQKAAEPPFSPDPEGPQGQYF